VDVQSSLSMLLIVLFCIPILLFSISCFIIGHRQTWTNLFFLFFCGVLIIVFCILEVGRLICDFLRLQPKKINPPKSEHRRIVIFDGICVLCNSFGRYVHFRFIENKAVDWVPYQDPDSHTHVNWKEIMEKHNFQVENLKDYIHVISGEKMYFGADAICEILSWCIYPFPIMKIAQTLIPFPLKDWAYSTIANNRYTWFGTQALDDNFAKKLCPIYYFK